MHHALKKVLQEALPQMVGGRVMVADELLESGGDEAFTRYLRRHLSNILADFIVDSKVLDGSDASCFTMVPDDKLAATRCEAKLHVLTPKELEALVTKAFEAGKQVGRSASKSYEQEFYAGLPKPYGPPPVPDWLEIEKPWPKPAKGYESKPLPKDIQEALKRVIENDFGPTGRKKS